MNTRILTVFGLGALAGYVAHREPVAPAAPHRDPPPAAAPVAPRIVVVPAPEPRVVEPEPELAPAEEAKPSAEPDVEPQGVLEGKVIDVHTGDGVGYVEVVAESPVTSPFRTSTDRDGAYRFDHLPSASYTVHFRYGDARADLGAGVGQLDPTTLDARIDFE